MPLKSAEQCALIIGNGQYAGNAMLPNPPNDAREMNNKLSRLGFTTFFDTDLNFAGMSALVKRFVSHIEKKNPVETALIYYSGHGQQVEDTNFLIPVDEGQFISLQDLIDQITPLSVRRLIFLDACRNNPKAVGVADKIARTRGYEFAGQPPEGLAEVTGSANTFIAFSAAPGKRASDGTEEVGLSPFTRALVDNIDAVDLPLDNVMARVKKEVQLLTSDAQNSWVSSALTDVFFFNPSSLLLLIGNAIGILALAAVMVAYSLTLVEWATRSDRSNMVWIGVAMITFLVVLGFFLAALNRAYARMRGEGGDQGGTDGVWRKVLSDGMIGGIFGGAIAAFTITIPYWYDWRNTTVWIEKTEQYFVHFDCTTLSWRAVDLPVECPYLGQLLTEITIAGVLIAALLGMLSMYCYGRLNRTNLNKRGFIQTRLPGIRGAVLGGLIAGVIAAPIVTAYFGSLDRPFLQPLFVLPGAVFSVAVIAFSIVNYSLEQFSLVRLWRSAWVALSATLVTGVLLGLAVLALVLPGIVEDILNWANEGFYGNIENHPAVAYSYLMRAGLVYGTVFGPFMGLLVGLTNAYTRES